MNNSILIVDDEKNQRESLAGYFKKKSYEVSAAESGTAALEKYNSGIYDIVLTDYKMNDMSGLDLLLHLKKVNPEVILIIMTAYGNIETAVEAMKCGAYMYLQKPVNLDELDILIERSILQKQIISENKKLRTELNEKFRFDSIIYNSKEIEEALNVAGRVASSDAPVLLRGESGTGKELFAKTIHYASSRKNDPFVTINCAALPETLLESEMFGYEKGAFTGADQRRIGRFEDARNGTIFIDEIGDISPAIQVKLLRVLQNGEFSRLGSNQIIKTNARIITATNRNLEEMIKSNHYREDFYYRINVVTVNIPPLRERKTDIPPLIDHFMKKYNCTKQISREAMDMLLKYNYPGNVRELENIVQRYCVLSRGELISVYDLPSNIRILHEQNSSSEFEPKIDDLNIQLENLERAILKMALNETNGNQSKAAKLLNISERNLRYKLEKLNL